MDLDAIKRSYRRYAPFYDGTFGWMLGHRSRRTVIDIANRYAGPVLEIGVGTGISLPYYRADHDVYGVDISPEMLQRAHKRVHEQSLAQVRGLDTMDAGELDFEDESFGVIVAAYVMSVVPDPEAVLREIERVCRPGGCVLIVNHFAAENGARRVLEQGLAPLSGILGFRPDMAVDEILKTTSLDLVAREPLAPFGLFTMLALTKPVNSRCAKHFTGVKSRN